MWDTTWRRVRMHWREELKTPKFTAHNKLCFDKDCFAHALQVACKAAILDWKLEDGEGHNWCVRWNGPKYYSNLYYVYKE